jgi:hypothetical protein
MVSFPDEFLEEVDRLAGEEHRSQSELIRDPSRTQSGLALPPVEREIDSPASVKQTSPCVVTEFGPGRRPVPRNDDRGVTWHSGTWFACLGVTRARFRPQAGGAVVGLCPGPASHARGAMVLGLG